MALSAAATYQLRNTGNIRWGKRQINTAVKVYKHALLAIPTANQAQLPATAAGLHFIGMAQESYTTSLATALTTAVFFWDCEVRLPAGTGCSAGVMEHACYAKADNVIHVVGGTSQGPPIGVMKEMDGTSYVWVHLGATALNPST